MKAFLGLLPMVFWIAGYAASGSTPESRATLKFSATPTVEEFFRARVFDEPLVPVAGEPSVAENVALASALQGYARRRSPDDFLSLTQFLDEHPHSPWNAALLT